MSSRSGPAIQPEASWPGRIADLVSLLCVAGGLVTLYGWIADLPRLTQWKNDGISMFPNTAVSVVAAGLALALVRRKGSLAVAIGRVLSTVVLFIGGLTLSEHIFGIDLGIDRLLSDAKWGHTAAASPLRMGPPASTTFTLLGSAMLLLTSTARHRGLAVGLALVALAISTLSVTGHLYGAEQMYTIPRLTGIAFQSATMILALSIGVLAAVPEREPFLLLLDRKTPGVFARRFLPVIVLLPLALGWARVLIQDAGLVDTAFGTAMRTLVEIALLVVLLWRGLRLLATREEALERSDAALRRQSEQLAAFLETAAVALHRADEKGTILWANDAELEMLGYSREDYVGHNIAQFHVDKPAIEDIYARLRRGENVTDYPARLLARDGTIREVLIDSSVLREDGRFIHTQSFTRDVTERVRADESRGLLASIVQASEDSIISKTLDGVITSWNSAAERLFGYTGAEAIGSNIEIIIPPERMSEEREIIARLRRGEGIAHFETVRRTKSGRFIDVSITVSPVRDSSGRVIGASKIARDVSERKRAETEREEASRRKDEFIAILAHELRNPLAPIRNAAHFLHAFENKDMQPAVRIIERQVAQMARLIDDLLDVSRISRGVLELRRERIEVSEIVDAAVEVCRDEMRSRNHALTIRLPDEHVDLDADRERLVQVLSNLLANAAKYTPPHGRIDLEVEAHGETLVITVRDDGIGIPPGKLMEIFELFTRVEQSLDKQGGLGIGLTLAQQIAGLHDGTIEARSEGLGFGSEFIVRLPIVAAAPRAASPAIAAEKGPSTPRRVLVADDNQDVAESLAMLLEFAGHEVHTAFDGEAAFRSVEELLPDVALLDIGMPKANGYEVATRVREKPWGREVFLVALTGWGQESDKRRAEQAGFDMHLVKPVAPETIEDLLDSLPVRRAAG
jgi:PAS domain S-box-containing protein